MIECRLDTVGVPVTPPRVLGVRYHKFPHDTVCLWRERKAFATRPIRCRRRLPSRGSKDDCGAHPDIGMSPRLKALRGCERSPTRHNRPLLVTGGHVKASISQTEPFPMVPTVTKTVSQRASPTISLDTPDPPADEEETDLPAQARGWTCSQWAKESFTVYSALASRWLVLNLPLALRA